MKLFLVLALLISPLARAQEVEKPDDAPMVFDLKEGEPAPAAGLLLPTETAIAQAKRIVGCEAERDELRKSATPSWLPVAVAGVLGLVIGGATVGIVAATRK